MSSNKSRHKAEFGDFQTPLSLAREVCWLLRELGCMPRSVIEPTCGKGNFITAALEHFTSITKVIGVDINYNYINSLATKFAHTSAVEIYQADFFHTDWTKVLTPLPDPLLVLGNPPWVTNSELATFGSNNLPQKNNFQKHAGLAALTGASNFDISEWMLINIFAWLRQRKSMLAVLCKTTVARKVLLHEWKSYPNSGRAQMFLIDALAEFNAAVDACLLVYDFKNPGTKTCVVYKGLTPKSEIACLGYERNQLIANTHFYHKWQHLQNNRASSDFIWRSGIKHDCSKVMELRRVGNSYLNRLGEQVELEKTFIYPLMKSSDVVHEAQPTRFMLVPQQFVGQETRPIQTIAPKTWAYLSTHQQYFTRRKSSIYQHKPPFSIFGVGDYSFAPWKVAIAGLYKKLRFVVVGPHIDKPVVFDDTCYFLACQSAAEATALATALNSQPAAEFFAAFIFWDAKRPITAKILNKLNLRALLQNTQSQEKMPAALHSSYLAPAEQLQLLERGATYTKNSLTASPNAAG